MLIITDYKKRYLQKENRFATLDIEQISSLLSVNSKVLTYNELLNGANGYSDEIILYTSSQVEMYKKYIDDLMYFYKENKLIPSYEVLRSHENKFFQELYNKKHEIKTNISSYLIGDIDDFKQLKDKLPKKFVIKKTNGSAGNNVYICESYNEGLKILSEIESELRAAYNKMTPSEYDLYPAENNTKVQAIIQEFKFNDSEEYRVHFMGDKIFGFLRKKIDENTLGSSGEFNKDTRDVDSDLPIELINYAREIKAKIDSPFAILDIIYDKANEEYCLIEWSGIHVGLNAITKGKRYYIFEEQEIKKCKYDYNENFLNEVFASAINLYIKEKKWI